MITLPDFEKSFEYENNFYLSCQTSRLTKILAHYEAFRLIGTLPGAVVECGVFKGTSLVRFAAFREMFGGAASRPIIGFDTFDTFPDTAHAGDAALRQQFIQAAGASSISSDQLMEVLRHKRLDQNVELVAGDITETLPAYAEKHPELKIALLNLDTDIYEPARVILEVLFPRLVTGGVLLIDDYGVFPGETQAFDAYFAGTGVKVQRFPFAPTPCFVVKE
jgi:hypothetical protein